MADALAGRYEPRAVVGRGGQGYVLHAIDTRHDRPVAIKVCNAATEDDRQTLLAEAKVLLTLDPHPNLPLVRDDFFAEDRYCVVMDWIDGDSLARTVDASDGRSDVGSVLDAVAQVAAALDHLHANEPPVLHRDVKPANIVERSDGRFVLVDLGLATPSARSYGVGTPDYLAPECAAGEPATAASDVFSLAVTAYELLTGTLPIPGQDTAIEGARSDDEARRLMTVLRRAMSTDPARRPRSAGEFADALQRRLGRSNLPASLSSFVGRDADLAELAAVVGLQRCVTLSGVGGVGKTRLALEAAQRAVGSFDAVWFVELAGLEDGTVLTDHVARSVGAREQRERDRSESLADVLGAGRQLLVLDNCEHIVDACAHLVEALLRACPDLSVLATSREPLRTVGEVVRRVGSMTLPDEAGRALESDAVRLFVERARAGDRHALDRPGDENLVADLCVALEGLPLGIELAAARIGELSLEELSDQLRDQLGALVRGPRTTPRHETLRAAIEWSYGLLSQVERDVLSELAVFAGTFGVDAARAVTAREDIDTASGSLVERSLCERRKRRVGGGLYLLAPVRAFGAERLDPDTADVVRRRHLRWHLELAEHARAQLRGAEQAASIDRLEDAYDDLRAALAWARSSGSSEEELRLAVAMAPFWNLRGDWTQGRAALEDALRHDPGTELAARGWVELGSLARLQGDAAAASSCFERAHVLAETHDAVVVSIAARAGLARLLSDRGDHADAQSVAAELLTRARELDDLQLVVVLLGDVGTSAQYLGDLDTARDAFSEAATIARSLGDVHSVANLAGSRGTVASVAGDIEAARELFTEQLHLARDLRDDALVATATSHLANCASREGDHGAACSLYEESLEVFRRIGHQWRVALTLSELGLVTAQAGDLDAARVLLNESLEIAVRCGFHLIQGETLHKSAQIANAQGDVAGSARALADAIRICREHGDTLRIVMLVEHAAVLAAGAGRPDDAIVLAAAAEAQRERVGFPRGRMPVLERVLEGAGATAGRDATTEATERGHALAIGDAVTAAIELCVDLVHA